MMGIAAEQLVRFLKEGSEVTYELTHLGYGSINIPSVTSNLESAPKPCTNYAVGVVVVLVY